MRRGDLSGARHLVERSAQEFAQYGNSGGEAYALHELARLKAMEGDQDSAIELLDRALRLSRDNDLHAACESIHSSGGCPACPQQPWVRLVPYASTGIGQVASRGAFRR
jgi:hypothetical protein